MARVRLEIGREEKEQEVAVGTKTPCSSAAGMRHDNRSG